MSRGAGDAGTRRVRVAYFVSPSAHFAGIERVVHEIATGLAEAHGDVLDVHVLYSTRYDEPLLADTRYTRHVLGVDRLRRLAATLRRCVAALDVDVLVVPQVEASVVAWLATRGLGLPVLVPHLHGNPRIEEADGTRRTRLAFALFRHVVSRDVAGVLAVSPSLRDHAARTVARRAPTRAISPEATVAATRRGSPMASPIHQARSVVPAAAPSRLPESHSVVVPTRGIHTMSAPSSRPARVTSSATRGTPTCRTYRSTGWRVSRVTWRPRP